MRLTHLKLAGFKSFVDPTTLHIHGQRVGVVGPNGCGKSNVMESVRWVLGESSAKEMRGDSMTDVIFNGSGNRKAISRASVELVFDNSLGGASGEWSQYAEIAVKRVIDREKGSTYYINNTAVRRRDVADLFLGTGLGGRAYAIIGQNTISRIVEAKPEEMRVFLEEAAGISKYKERRRETELRLRDTRDNLLRMQDIRNEIAKQIERLESQAVVTAQYHQLHQKLKHLQGQIWLLKKREANLQWDKSHKLVEKLVNDLEAQMASLRKAETSVETLRQSQYTCTDQLQQAQTLYYESNAEVSNLENQVKHTQEARDRLSMQLQQMAAQSQKFDSQSLNFREELQQLQNELNHAEQQLRIANQQADEIRRAMPQATQQFNQMQQRHILAQKNLVDTEQSIRLEATNLDHLERSQRDLQVRLERLQVEQAQLTLPDEAILTTKRAALAQALEALHTAEAEMVRLREGEAAMQATLKSARDEQLQHERALTQVEAQMHSLEKIQSSIGQESKLTSWIAQYGLGNAQKLWQCIQIAPGWEKALESLLGLRLNALVSPKPLSELNIQQRPPAGVVLCESGGANITEKAEVAPAAGLTSLRSLVAVSDANLACVMDGWLQGIYICQESCSPDLDVLANASYAFVNAAGDVFGRHSAHYFGAQSALHGVLERQRELEALKRQQPDLKHALEAGITHLRSQENQLREQQLQVQSLQQTLRNLTQTQHQLSLEIQRDEQQYKHLMDKQQSITAEINTVSQRLTLLQTEIQQKGQSRTAFEASLHALNTACDEAKLARQQAELTLNHVRESLQQAERQLQEKTFNEKLINNNINELNNKINYLDEEKKSLSVRQKEAETMLEAAKMESLKANLENAINQKQLRETQLAEARNQLADIEQQLQHQERNRMQSEQMLHPMRDKLENARLQEQQARLHFEQCQAALLDAQVDEAVLQQNLSAHAKPSDIEATATQVAQSIEELGAVNLAAIQELANEKERKSYLDSQATDLEAAVATLEDAIKRIDKETRARLQQTFDEANRHFSELFMTLFGGGQAKLELLGEEILDTGIQVFAQPPGKKNSTIHLLSGGEKALTALALVFALFRLNPAPFCLMDEVDAPLDDSNTERFCNMVKKMSERTQFLFVSHNKITMEMAQQLIGVTMQESGVSRIVDVDMEAAIKMQETLV